MKDTMLKIADLNLGYNDAENYKKPENKDLFNRIFVQNVFLDRISKPSTYFVLGEKGTGKTAYAVYFSNNNYQNTAGALNYIRETDYQKFIALKKENHLGLSDFTSIWKIIIYLLISEQISQNESKGSFFSSSKFESLQAAIQEYYVTAFSPEILQALSFVEKSKFSANLIAKYINLGSETVKEGSFTHNKFQTNLFYIQKNFEDALKSITISKNHTIFIDGIDIRPRGVEFEGYLECIKGLGNAIWSVNNDVFSLTKGEFKLKAVLLIRPDIYAHLGLQNPNNKLRDNGVILNWYTTFKDYNTSQLFQLVEKLLNAQQPSTTSDSNCWNHYFPYKVRNKMSKNTEEDSFVEFLRYSYFKPRDFISMLSILKDNFMINNRDADSVFNQSDFNNDSFRSQYSEYLIGEIKDQILFYNSEEEYQIFIDFFQYLEGKTDFNYVEFETDTTTYLEHLHSSKIQIPNFLLTINKFLQFLYENNVISYVERSGKETFMRWCYRERSYSNVNPKVKLNSRYKVHYGLQKSLNLGRKISNDNSPKKIRRNNRKPNH